MYFMSTTPSSTPAAMSMTANNPNKIGRTSEGGRCTTMLCCDDGV